MAPIIKEAKVADAEAAQELAQFEPDPDGDGSVACAPEAAAPDGPVDPQWVTWGDREGESAWADSELGQITPASAR
jgi:hypothetical protein